MPELTEVEVRPLRPERFEEVLPAEAFRRFAAAIQHALELLDGRVVWNINSTARGGGVAEMLQSLLAYARGAGVDARWLVIQGEPAFFRVTKRIHNHLHGAPGDGGRLGEEEKRAYEAALKTNEPGLKSRVSEGDIVIVHDPQPAGLISTLRDVGATVIWRCHVGLDMPNDLARRAWNFLIPYVRDAEAYVFSREAYAWEGLDPRRISIVPPSIDAFSPKNQDLERGRVDAILERTGILDGGGADPKEALFLGWDGTEKEVRSTTRFADGGNPPTATDRLVVQVSRWDRLKDPIGVIDGFVEHVAPHQDAHLIVAGPEVEAVSDDPEGAEVLRECSERWEAIDPRIRPRVHLAALPMKDGEENAAIVNALQRRANIVVQKSLAEGFGLTVAEAMWKARPVVATRIGGIQDQVIDGVSGILIDDPRDLSSYGSSVATLLDDEDRAAEMGAEAQRRVRDGFLGPRHLMQYIDLIDGLTR